MVYINILTFMPSAESSICRLHELAPAALGSQVPGARNLHESNFYLALYTKEEPRRCNCSVNTVQGSAKRSAYFVKQQAGKSRQKS